MLDEKLKSQLTSYLEKVKHPVALVASLDDGEKSRELAELLDEIASLSGLVSVRHDGGGPRTPAFTIERVGTDIGVTFAGIPLGHEFTSLVLALLQVGGHPMKASDEMVEQIRMLDGDLRFETYFSLSCQNCPEVVQAINAMSVINPNIRHVAIDGALFRSEVESRQVMAVPSVFLNGEPFDQGRMTLEQIVARLDTASETREAEKMGATEPFDMLVVGGGPAGASAAVYAARKGIRTGLAAERFGGQVADTMGIENFISVPYTEGPKLVTALEEHVKQYDVDIMNLQRATALVPAAQPGGLHRLEFANGASLSARSVVIATGARWRPVNVPGEAEYRNRGVAYCPHCDGPLFKGKRVAVIGGGNSGVEAAIDLAGVVEHVTLLEFESVLRADAVLQRKLHSLPNVDVLTSAKTTEITGDGERVNGLAYVDRESGSEQHVALAGVFVQIGLVPNTEWLKGTVNLSRHGEIEVNDRGETSIPGAFAAGDATTVPFKQIVIALGDGSRAALGAFDYLIRTPVPESELERARAEAAA